MLIKITDFGVIKTKTFHVSRLVYASTKTESTKFFIEL